MDQISSSKAWKPLKEFVVSYDSLLINENDEKAWFYAEHVFKEKNYEYKSLYKILYQMQIDGIVRDLKSFEREESTWLI